ncbi:pheromone precursor protein 2 [Fusarium austroafricanum]|uniref:Pheromone protein 2 n=1 Tax=Fusarium austroafricanum TaxID=2364996 RepID=A0A8H4KPS7_9HYPO|nr:pheromone precursor protein 2 [Fusarium austroafricanum]
MTTTHTHTHTHITLFTILNTEHSPTFLSLSTPTSKMHSTKANSQTPAYPLSCSIMKKPEVPQAGTSGYPLSCPVMKKPEVPMGGNTGYPLSCTVM